MRSYSDGTGHGPVTVNGIAHDQWQVRFKAWQDYAAKVRQHADNVSRMRTDRAFALAASVGIGRCACSLHNASIDTELRGWCAGNPQRLKVAKRATHILNDWRASQLADRIISRAFDQINK